MLSIFNLINFFSLSLHTICEDKYILHTLRVLSTCNDTVMYSMVCHYFLVLCFPLSSLGFSCCCFFLDNSLGFFVQLKMKWLCIGLLFHRKWILLPYVSCSICNDEKYNFRNEKREHETKWILSKAIKHTGLEKWIPG